MEVEEAKEIISLVDRARVTEWLSPVEIGWCSLEVKRLKDKGVKAMIVKSTKADRKGVLGPVIAVIRVVGWTDEEKIKEAYLSTRVGE